MQTTQIWHRDFTQTNTPENARLSALEITKTNQYTLLGFEDTLEVIDTHTGKTINKLTKLCKKGILRIVVSKYGNYFVTIFGDLKVVVWDGAELEPHKKLSLSSKTTKVVYAGFNSNETTLYIITNAEIIVFKTKATEKGRDTELQRMAVKDREIEGACYIEPLNSILVADDHNFISIMNTKKLERENLTQKMATVNCIKYFEDGGVWVLYANNTVAVYEVDEEGLKLNSFEKKTPFELLDVIQLNKDLYIASGFSDEVILLNAKGYYLSQLSAYEGAVLIRRMAYSKDSNTLLVSPRPNELIACRLTEQPVTFFQDNLWLKVRDLSILEVTAAGQHNNGVLSSSTGLEIGVNGVIKSVSFCKESYLSVLVQSRRESKIHLIEAKSIVKSIYELGADTLEDDLLGNFNVLHHEKKPKILKITSDVQPIHVYTLQANLLVVYPSFVLLTDFGLNTLKSWKFSSPVVFTKCFNGMKRKESMLVSLTNGELLKLSIDNPFTARLLDYKVPITYFELNSNRTKLLIVDDNANFVLYDYSIESLALKETANESKVKCAKFHSTHPEVYAYLTTDSVLMVKHQRDGLPPLQNIFDANSEVAVDFSKTVLTVKSTTTNKTRSVPLVCSPLIDALVQSKKYEEALKLSLALGMEYTEDMQKLATASIADLSMMSLKVARYIDDRQLKYFCAKVANEKVDTGAVIKAEMMAYEGKYTSGVELLVSEKLIPQAIEMLVTLGKYDHAVKILKNPANQMYLKGSTYDLTALIKLQAEAAASKGDYQLALDLYGSIKESDEIAKILIKLNKEQDLMSTVRGLDSSPTSKRATNRAFGYFKEKGLVAYAKECLIKLDKEEELLDLYIGLEMFDEALQLYETIALKKVIEPEVLYIPYAAYLLQHNEYEKALECYIKIQKPDLCRSVLRKFIRLNTEMQNFELAAKFTYELNRLDDPYYVISNSEIFFLVLNRFLRKYEEALETGEEQLHTLNLLVVLLNLSDMFAVHNVSIDMTDYITNCADLAFKTNRYSAYSYLNSQKDTMGCELSSQLDFVAGLISSKAVVSNDYLVHCFHCDYKGYNFKDLKCSSCGLRLFFCLLSGRQLPLLGLQMDANIGNASYLALDGSKWFKASKGPLHIKSEWKQGLKLDDPFRQLVRETYTYNNSNGLFSVNSVETLKEIEFDRFIEIEEKRFYYRYGQEDSIMINQNSGTMYLLDAFETAREQWCCEVSNDDQFTVTI